MGVGNSTEADIMKQSITNISLEVMNRMSSSSNLSSEQLNKLVFANLKNTTIDGVVQQNKLTANLSTVSRSALNGDLQRNIIASINEQLNQEMGNLQMGSQQKTKVNSLVENTVNTSITNENLTEIKVRAKQNNEVVFTNLDSVTATNILQGNEQDLVVQLISEMSSDIVDKIQSDSDIKGLVSQSNASFLELGLGIALIVLLIGIGLWVAKDTTTELGKQALQPETILAGTLSVLVISFAWSNL